MFYGPGGLYRTVDEFHSVSLRQCHGNNVAVNQRTPLKSAKTAHSLGVSLALRRLRVFAQDMGVSENSVPLNPMVNDHYPY